MGRNCNYTRERKETSSTAYSYTLERATPSIHSDTRIFLPVISSDSWLPLGFRIPPDTTNNAPAVRSAIYPIPVYIWEYQRLE